MLCVCLLQAWYLGYGAKDVLEQSCKALQSKIEVLFVELTSEASNHGVRVAEHLYIYILAEKPAFRGLLCSGAQQQCIQRQ